MKVCPCCGTDIVLDAPIIMNDYAMSGAGYPLFHGRQQIKLTPAQALICWSLMKAYPGYVTINALVERLGADDVKNPENLIRVHMSHMKQRFRDHGLTLPIVNCAAAKNAYIWDPRI